MLLARRLGETGAPPALVAATDEVVDNFFRDGHQPHRIDALQALSVFKPLDLHGRYPQQGRRWGSP
jgi:hypothetical protein